MRYNRGEEYRVGLGMVPTMISCVQSRGGGVSLEAITPDSHGHVSSQGILSGGCLCRRELTQLWGFYGVLFHVVLPHLNLRRVKGSTVPHVIECEDEGPCF